MDELIRQMIAQSPAVAVLIFLVWRLDMRLEELTQMLIDLCKQEQDVAHSKSVEK